jgi:hypothetical protein
VDRRAVQPLYPGPAQITCQHLPPNFPGYQPYCPHTLNPSPAGAWTALDRATATRLIDQSGTRGMRVTVWSYSEFAAISRYFVRLLNTLGYKARLRIIGPDFDAFWVFVNDSRNKAQMAAYWYQGALSPAEAIVGLRCRSFVPNSADNENTAQFCSGPSAGHPAARPRGDQPGVQAGRQLPAQPAMGDHPQPALGDVKAGAGVGRKTQLSHPRQPAAPPGAILVERMEKLRARLDS